MPKMIRYLGPPGSRFFDNETDTYYEGYGEAVDTPNERAEYLLALRFVEFEEVKRKEDAGSVDPRAEFTETTSDPLTGDVRFVDPDTGDKRMTPKQEAKPAVSEEVK